MYVKWHFTSTKLVAAIFGGKLFTGSVLPASGALVVLTDNGNRD